jgi:2-polyprenyl-3-methyl-5-hydroxy-6-metoxy-1,4-benzoquinol methylase
LNYILEHKKIKSLLDIGAGTGYFVNHAKENGIVVQGFEPDADARQQAQKNFNISLHPSLEAIFNQNQSFDAISMWHVLEHVHELDAYFQHFNTLLNHNGLLVIAVPNYTSYDAQFYKEYWAAYDLPKHLWHFSPQSIKKLAANHQFQHVQSYAMPFDSFYIALLSEGHKKSGVLGKIRALFVGTISYLKAFFSAEKASSVVYVFRKN